MAEGHCSGNTDELLGVFDRLLNFFTQFFSILDFFSVCHKVAHDKL